MKIHPQFKLNGHSYNSQELLEVAYSWIKEGEDFEAAAGDFILDWLAPTSTVLVKTSGSTGVPKQITLLKAHMVNSALATAKYFNLAAGDTALQCLATHYIAGKMMLVRAMVLGLHVDIVAPTATPLSTNNKTYKFAAMVPLQAQQSLKELYRIQQLIIGGAPIGIQLKEQLLASPNQVFETYGMTETITHIAVKQISESSFKALPEVVLTTDQRGCLMINAPNVCKEKLITNDVVKLLTDTEFEWLGRADNVINSGGVKLFPEQIEAKLSAIIPQRFMVAGLPHKELGQQLVLLIEGQSIASALNNSIAQLPSLGKYELPKKIISVPKFRETVTGKVNRAKTLALVG